MGDRSVLITGLDVGSVSVKRVDLGHGGEVIGSIYLRHRGRTLQSVLEILRDGDRNAPVVVTGTGSRVLGEALGLRTVNEVVAHGAAAARLVPDVRSVIEMGGEDSKFIAIEGGRIKDFSMNALCAAGTGSFLDQQAERLQLSIEDFGKHALVSKNPPRIAGRCSVFAKSDMIHLQQIATPVEDVVAGLCFAVARNFKSAICKGRIPPSPVVFQGGVAANPGMVRAFKQVFGFEDIIIPDVHLFTGALGAALVVLEKEDVEELPRADLGKLQRCLENGVFADSASLKPLLMDLPEFSVRHVHGSPEGGPQRGGGVDVTLGIDIGSISTNLAVVDLEGRLLSKRYLMTAGRPIEAVRRGLGEIGEELGRSVNVVGVGTTGSGRYMISDFVGADVVKNEITAQAAAAASIDPEVESIFEIGGQDSKYIALRNGAVVDFEMNKACAAGTGSFLEEQAERLNMSVKRQFEELAFCSGQPCSLGERCTVFMENNLRARQQQGAPVNDLVAGLAYSIVRNYLNRVVGDRQIGKKIFFQGGTAFNKAVVAAFEQVVGRPVVVPPNHDVTGAIGMALIAADAMKARGNPGSTFKGFDLSTRSYSIKSFECKGCSNVCEINRVSIDGEKDSLFYGGRCEKYDRKARTQKGELPDLFEERERMLVKSFEERCENAEGPFRATIGIPRVFFMQEFLPLWVTWLSELGFRVVLSPSTGTGLIREGVESVLAEACFPVKVAHGHIRSLLANEEVDAIWLPSYINLIPTKDDSNRATACPYTQTIPYVSRAALGDFPALVPIIDMEVSKGKGLPAEVHRVLKPFKISLKAVKKAYEKAATAQENFKKALVQRGQQALDGHVGRAVVIVGRPYNAFDPAMNLNLHRKLIDLGVLPVPMDMLPLDREDLKDRYPDMYWRSGRRILTAADIIRDDPRLHAIFITNFSCGPDSFVLRFFKERMGGAPFLQIEIDEHSADAGAVTRCEAFLDSLENVDELPKTPREFVGRSMPRKNGKRTVFIPHMSDHTFGLAAAFRACGIDAEVLPESTVETTELGRRYVSGKECYPCAVTTGDMVARATSAGFEPRKSAFFMPSGSGPCRFGQYNVLHRMVLDDIGFADVPILSPMQESSFYEELGGVDEGFARIGFQGIAAIDLLVKCLHETRPYERDKGETDDLYGQYLAKISETVAGGNGAMPDLLREMARDFRSVPRENGGGRRPRIGIVGEIFVRSNPFSNEELIRRIENLGGEAWLAPISEWIFYINRMGLRRSRIRGNWRQALRLNLEHTVQERIERAFGRPFDNFLETLHEPQTDELLELAGHYLHDSFEGEAVLSLGKAIDLFNKGCAGVISAMPFGCMPGTIVSGLLKKLKDDFEGPTLSIAFDGTASSGSALQLEAFMHQAREYDGRGGKKAHVWQ